MLSSRRKSSVRWQRYPKTENLTSTVCMTTALKFVLTVFFFFTGSLGSRSIFRNI